MMKASGIAERRLTISPIKAVPPCPPCSRRSSNGLKTGKIAAWFEALVKVAPEKPAKATVFEMPGISRSTLAALSTVSLVRVSDAPSGSCTTTIA
jgi:hypothetical protein